MRAALPLKATNARAELTRTNTLRAQIDELSAALAVANAEADRALTEERQRADRLNEQVEALSAKVVRAEKQAAAAIGRAERAEAGRDAERARAGKTTLPPLPSLREGPLLVQAPGDRPEKPRSRR
jgi:septal ring factor EnvC (AmiA/AmiB activator)